MTNQLNVFELKTNSKLIMFTGNDNGGTIVLVAQDGVQQPPIHFPQGGHLLAFLTCLENGLLPHGQLDPPLWPQRGKGRYFIVMCNFYDHCM